MLLAKSNPAILLIRILLETPFAKHRLLSRFNVANRLHTYSQNKPRSSLVKIY